MRPDQKLSIGVILLVILLPACSTHQARQEIEAYQKEGALKTLGWQVARVQLKSMCPEPPKTMEEYRQRKEAIRVSGQGPSQGCDMRIVKLSNAPVFDDWQWDWLPSYQTIVSVHIEEVRRRVTPRVYDEFMFALASYLAAKADEGTITGEQLVAGFNQGWKWMFEKMREDAILLQVNLQTAQQSDAAVWNALGNVAVGLAAVSTAALVASAAANAYRPAPVNCVASRVGAFVNVSCY